MHTREAAKRGLSSIPVGRNVSTTKFSSDKVHVGNALDPTTYEDLLEQHDVSLSLLARHLYRGH